VTMTDSGFHPAQPYTLRGFVPGVYRVHAYLTKAGEEVHWRGGHDTVLGKDAEGRLRPSCLSCPFLLFGASVHMTWRRDVPRLLGF
jgi:hypothetical protein